MNGEYVFSTTTTKDASKYPKQYRDYPGGVEAFDVYSGPITTRYSQVWWAPLAPAPFPDEIVQKYKGKGMAIVGWEIDQVRKGAGPNGQDVSVPISATYNHHYTAKMTGAGARFKKVMLSGLDDPLAARVLKESGHGMVAFDQPHYIADDDEARPPTVKGAAHTLIVSSANGGEYRKSFHGYAPGYAVVIESPESLQITPMQIDTWNREAMNISQDGTVKFVAGPLPAAAQSPEGAPYSGLLECPMTTRITKLVSGSYVLQGGATAGCTDPILTFQECFHAAATTLRTGGQSFSNETGTDLARPRGCSVTTDPASPLKARVFFNKAVASTVACAAGAATLVGGTSSVVNLSVTLDVARSAATITVAGPSTVWFGVGFGATTMADQPWTVIVDGNTGEVSERKLGGPGATSHQPGTLLAPSVKVVSNAVSQGVRTVVLSRAFTGAGPAYFNFNASAADPTIPFISAVGSGPVLAYHANKAPSMLTLLPAGSAVAGACVCPEKPAVFGQASGSLRYNKVASQPVDVGVGSVGFSAGKCAPYPRTVLNEQQNPTCDIRHYTGGQWACHHMWSLLDADQEIPWVDQPLVFYHKWRIWVQPYNESYHTPLHYGQNTDLTIGSPYEYDVPKCAPGVPGCSMVDGTWIHTITGNRIGSSNFAAMNFHCHAPTCLMMAVYACGAGTPLTDCNATNGKLICMQKPIYGGTSNPLTKGTRFDEDGYIAIPGCIWGKEEDGLVAPPNLGGLSLHVVKTANATNGHYGEMAGGQPWVYD